MRSPACWIVSVPNAFWKSIFPWWPPFFSVSEGALSDGAWEPCDFQACILSGGLSLKSLLSVQVPEMFAGSAATRTEASRNPLHAQRIRHSRKKRKRVGTIFGLLSTNLPARVERGSGFVPARGIRGASGPDGGKAPGGPRRAVREGRPRSRRRPGLRRRLSDGSGLVRSRHGRAPSKVGCGR